MTTQKPKIDLKRLRELAENVPSSYKEPQFLDRDGSDISRMLTPRQQLTNACTKETVLTLLDALQDAAAALEFYGNRKKWTTFIAEGDAMFPGMVDGDSCVAFNSESEDGSEHARAALDKLREIGIVEE